MAIVFKKSQQHNDKKEQTIMVLEAKFLKLQKRMKALWQCLQEKHSNFKAKSAKKN